MIDYEIQSKDLKLLLAAVVDISRTYFFRNGLWKFESHFTRAPTPSNKSARERGISRIYSILAIDWSQIKVNIAQTYELNRIRQVDHHLPSE
jgi:hypothetical protein